MALAQETPTFHAGVTLVRVDVQVTSETGVIADLSSDDFVLLDENKPQHIAYFGRESEPLWVLLLLDTSGSMGRFVEQMAAVSRQALAALNPGDHAGVMLFSRRSAVREPFTSDFERVSRAIGDAVLARDLGAATRINTAIIDGASYVRKTAIEERGRRAVVILTDNGGINYRVPNEMVIRALYDADAVLNAILIGNAVRPLPPRKEHEVNPDFTQSDVFTLTSETGGEIIRAKKAGSAFSAMMEHIRTRYSLHYYSPGGALGSFRNIRVELSAAARQRHRHVTIRARSGYYVPSAP